MKRQTMILQVSLGVMLSHAALAASPYDGVYSGSATWAGNGHGPCQPPPDFKVTIRDGQFNYGRPEDRVPVTVGPDGSFSAQSGQRYLQGKVSGAQMTASTSGGNCNYLWSLRK